MLDSVITDAGYAGQTGHAAVHLAPGDPSLDISISWGATKLTQT